MKPSFEVGLRPFEADGASINLVSNRPTNEGFRPIAVDPMGAHVITAHDSFAGNLKLCICDPGGSVDSPTVAES